MLVASSLLIGIGVSYIQISYNQSTYTGMVVEAKNNYYIVSSQLERLYIYEKGHVKEVGDIVEINGYKKEVDVAVIESGFDFKDYLDKKGIRYQFVVKSTQTTFKVPLRIREYQKEFLSHYSSETKGLLSGILFASNEDYEGKDDLDGLHLNRLITASGIYYAMYLSFFTIIFSFMMKDRYAKLCGIVVLLLFSFIIPGRFSLLRFLVFAVFRYFNEYKWHKKFEFFSYYPFIGILFILFDYHLVYSDSFILGFAIPILVQLISHSFPRVRLYKKKALIYGLILLFFIPFDIRYHHEINFLSYPLQLIMMPLFILDAYIGLFAFMGIPIYVLNEGISFVILQSAKWINSLPFKIYLPPFNDYLYLFYYGLYFVSLYYFSIHYRLIYKWLLSILSVFVITYVLPIKNGLTTSVTFINVGQGDCCLITSQYHTVMIDTGGSIYQDIATNCLIPYLKSQRIYNIDLLMTTHDDYDHMGASSSLIEHFSVRNYIKDASLFPIDYGGIHFVNYNNYFSSTSPENDQSLVIGFKLSGIDYLVMGDAPIAVENKMMQDYSSIPCDVLKVGHHGSDTSTSDAFIRYLSPKEAIISVGKNNYGHPHQSVINTLKRHNVIIRQTNIEGSISYSSSIFAL